VGLTNRELLDLIGEIDGIQLRSLTERSGVDVYLQIGDREFELITDSGDAISHHITRIGISSVISCGGKPINNSPEVKESHERTE
jgi:hypothetical protein